MSDGVLTTNDMGPKKRKKNARTCPKLGKAKTTGRRRGLLGTSFKSTE